MIKIKNKGFTLIELIVILVVVGILVLLSALNLSGYTSDAKMVQMKNDVKLVENKINNEIALQDSENDYFVSYNHIDVEKMNEYISNKQLYDVKGLIDQTIEDNNDEYYEIPMSIKKSIGSKLKGDFIVSNKGGKVYYYGVDLTSKQEKYDKDGYDRDGYDKDGYDRDGYDKDGYDKNDYDKDGYDKDGYDKDGYDEDGYNKDGYDRNNLGKLTSQRLTDFKAGSVIMFGGIDWILLDPELGYLVLRGKENSLTNGYGNEVDFDWNDNPVFNPRSDDNIAYMLNQIMYMMPDYPKKREFVSLVKEHTWNIGGLKFEDVYGEYWTNPGDGLSFNDIVKKERTRTARSYGGLLSVSDVLKYSKTYAHIFGFEGVLDVDFFGESGSAWLINSFVHDNNRIGTSPWSISLGSTSSRIISQGSSARSKAYAIPTIYVKNDVTYEGYNLKK